MPAERSADWLPVAEARARILAAVSPPGEERRELLSCLGHVLAEDVVSPIDLPAHDNSAMDGFAVRAADIAGASAEAPRELPVVADLPAGAAPAAPLPPGAAARIMTGAPVPEGADSVVRVEHTDGGRLSGGRGSVRVLSAADALRNVRRAGEDVRRGSPVLRRGAILGPGALGLAASVGRAELPVVRKPVVAVLTSGDELVELDRFDEVLAGRRIVSSNSYALAAQLAEIGVEPRLLGIAPDDPRALREHLERARGCDALVTSAGISMGEHDLVLRVLADLDTRVDFWRVRMRPGSPFAFGRVGALGGIPWFGLPGNPVSSMVTFEVFARPALLKMCGRSAVFAPTEAARLEAPYTSGGGLTHFARVRLRRDGGETLASLTGPQGSGILTSMAAADGLLVVPETMEVAGPEEALPVLLLGGAPLREEPGY